jgi:outer membrane protein assembly factor BamB
MTMQSRPTKWPEMFPDKNPLLDTVLKDVLLWMWQDLTKPFNQSGLLPLAICDTAANQTNYPATGYPEGALFFANDTHHLYVDSYSTGTPTWTQVV